MTDVILVPHPRRSMAQLEPLAAEFHRDGAQLAYIAAEKRGGMSEQSYRIAG